MSEDQPGGNGDGLWAEPEPPVVQLAATEQIRLQPPSPPQTPRDRWRTATVGVLNLSGLGLGYALTRRWRAAVLCWIATGILLLVALPADPNGVPGALLVLYLIVLGFAAVHGALRGPRTPLAWPRRPQAAMALAVVLLAVPVGAGAFYDHAQVNATQQLLLDRLAKADQLVAATKNEPFAQAQSQYDTAMVTYRDLLANNRSSQAGHLVPDRLTALYQTAAAPYARQDYCDAIAPLTYLRGLSGTVTADGLGSLATWPDDRLATSLYQCGVAGLGTDGSSATTDLNKLLSTFPASSQAGRVPSAVASAIGKAAAGIGGSTPCTATSTLDTLTSQASAISGGTDDVTAALQKDADTAGTDDESGTYACGVSQYKSGDFADAETTMEGFTTNYPHDPRKALAQNYDIAAQIADQDSAAGKVVPTLATGGSVEVTIINDSPDALKVLYTGPVTGSVDLGACGKCSTYSNDTVGQEEGCTDSSINYPQTTIRLQPGTTYFLQQNPDDSGSTPNASSQHYNAGDVFEDCAYETSFIGSLL
jgi:hypothetical protein